MADADFDRLVDGDTHDDGKEIDTGTNPLTVDFQVTVFVTSLTLTQDGDAGGAGSGDIGFDIGIRKPDNTQPAGLSNELTSIVSEMARIYGPFNID